MPDTTGYPLFYPHEAVTCRWWRVIVGLIYRRIVVYYYRLRIFEASTLFLVEDGPLHSLRARIYESPQPTFLSFLRLAVVSIEATRRRRIDFPPNGCIIDFGLELANTATSATLSASVASFVRLVACWMAFSVEPDGITVPWVDAGRRQTVLVI